MKQILLIVCYIATITLAYEIIPGDNGDFYYLVPLSRRPRDLDWKVEDPGRLNLKLYGDLYKDDNNQLKGALLGSKNFANKQEPASIGGELGYTHLPSGSNVGVSAMHQETYGTDLGVGAKLNVYKNGPLSVDITGDYERHYGGRFGTQPPQWKTMLNGRIDF